VFGADVVVTQAGGLREGSVPKPSLPGGERNVTGGCLLALANDFLNLLAHGLERNLERFESFRGNTFTLVNQAQEDVLGADVVVVEHLGFFLSQNNDAPSAVGKPLKHSG
jgi:hypothetical protein